MLSKFLHNENDGRVPEELGLATKFDSICRNKKKKSNIWKV
jgi:hypothetical protein